MDSLPKMTIYKREGSLAKMEGLTWINWCFLYFGIVSSLFTRTEANWMYLGMASIGAVNSPPINPVSLSRSPEECGVLPGLVLEQLRVCKENPEAMPCVGLGARLGIGECHYQFKYERWNCTTQIEEGEDIFGQVLTKGTKETAFIHAITSAGVVHAVTQSCSAGNLTDCSCDNSRHGQLTQEGWKWGGCSDNIDYGIWFARTFVDAPERIKHTTTKDVRALMNLHNNEVGRRVIANTMMQKCRCHGVSGSCAVKTCWKTMPNFRDIGQVIKRKYETAVEIAPRSKKKLRRRDRRQRRQIINEVDLVFMEDSPNYCRPNKRLGILGTRGRECKRDTRGPDSCDMLCCGRGYNTKVVRYVERCHCKFIWCCEVKCKTCETLVDVHTCK